MEKDVVEDLIISKEDFENYFGSRKIINKKEAEEYYSEKLKQKGKNCIEKLSLFYHFSFQ